MYTRLFPGFYWRSNGALGIRRIVRGGTGEFRNPLSRKRGDRTLPFDDLVKWWLDDPETFSFLLKSLKVDKIRAKQLKVHSFVKAEQYPGFKMPRSINGRVDFSKIIFGPLVKTVEKIVYNNPCFIKNVPVNDRPQYITEKISGPGKYIATDYTSY